MLDSTMRFIEHLRDYRDKLAEAAVRRYEASEQWIECPKCETEVPTSNGIHCPSCGEDMRGGEYVRAILHLVDDADGTIVFNTGENTVKGRNLRRAGYAAMCVDDERPPFSFVVVEGPVTLSDDMDELRRWATAIGGRYMGEHDAEAFGARNAVPGELVARLTPERVTSAKDVAD